MDDREQIDLRLPAAARGTNPAASVSLSKRTVDLLVGERERQLPDRPVPVADPNAASVWDRPNGRTTLWGIPVRIDDSLALRQWAMHDRFDAIIGTGML